MGGLQCNQGAREIGKKMERRREGVGERERERERVCVSKDVGREGGGDAQLMMSGMLGKYNGRLPLYLPSIPLILTQTTSVFTKHTTHH